MKRLPLWVLTDKFPAFYDTESATAIEQTAKVYGAMQELVNEYNAFAETVNQNIEEYEKDYKADYELFAQSMNQQFQDFINVVELKIQAHNTEFENEVAEAKTEFVSLLSVYKVELEQTLNKLINQSNFVTREELETNYATKEELANAGGSGGSGGGKLCVSFGMPYSKQTSETFPIDIDPTKTYNIHIHETYGFSYDSVNSSIGVSYIDPPESLIKDFTNVQFMDIGNGNYVFTGDMGDDGMWVHTLVIVPTTKTFTVELGSMSGDVHGFQITIVEV